MPGPRVYKVDDVIDVERFVDDLDAEEGLADIEAPLSDADIEAALYDAIEKQGLDSVWGDDDFADN